MPAHLLRLPFGAGSEGTKFPEHTTDIPLAQTVSTLADTRDGQAHESSEDEGTAAATLRRLLSQKPTTTRTTTKSTTAVQSGSTCWENVRRNCNQKLQLCLQKVAIIANKLNPFEPPEPLLTDEMAAAVDVAYIDAQAAYRRQTEKWEASHEAERKFERRESERQASLRSSSSASVQSSSPQATPTAWATQINCPCTAPSTGQSRTLPIPIPHGNPDKEWEEKRRARHRPKETQRVEKLRQLNEDRRRREAHAVSLGRRRVETLRQLNEERRGRESHTAPVMVSC
jgi:hypothetical protein